MAFHRAGHQQPQLGGIPRLVDEVVDAGGIDGLHQGLGIGEGGEEDPNRVGRDVTTAGQQLGSEHPRHPLIAHDDRDGLRGERLERGLRFFGAEHPVVHAEQGLERVEHPRLVVHQENVAASLMPSAASSGCAA
jgi:hypothetical protein